MFSLRSIVKSDNELLNHFRSALVPATNRPLNETSNSKAFDAEKKELLRFLDQIGRDEINISKLSATWGNKKADKITVTDNLLLKHIQRALKEFRNEPSVALINQHSDFDQLKYRTSFSHESKRSIPYNTQQLEQIFLLIQTALPQCSRNKIARFIMAFFFEMNWLDKQEFKQKHNASLDEHSFEIFTARTFLNLFRK